MENPWWCLWPVLVDIKHLCSVWSLYHSAQCLKSQGLMRLGYITFIMKKAEGKTKPYASLKQVNQNVWHKTIPGTNTTSILTFKKTFKISTDCSKTESLLQEDFSKSVFEQKSSHPWKCFRYKKPHMTISCSPTLLKLKGNLTVI